VKNHIGYLESTPFACALSVRVGQKERFPTKNTPNHTLFVEALCRPIAVRLKGDGCVAANLPEFVGPQAWL
jgi:hypothetical protein